MIALAIYKNSINESFDIMLTRKVKCEDSVEISLFNKSGISSVKNFYQAAIKVLKASLRCSMLYELFTRFTIFKTVFVRKCH